MVKEIFYASTNQGKIEETRKYFSSHGINIVTPQDLNISPQIEETGETLEENALIKAVGYENLVQGLPILADDTGLYIEALNGEPGVYIRRWKDRSGYMDDEEIVEYTLLRLKGVPYEHRQAQFSAAVALVSINGQVQFFNSNLQGIILDQPANFKIPKYPYEALFFVPDWGKLLGEVYYLPASEKIKYPTHRDKVNEKVLAKLSELYRA